MSQEELSSVLDVLREKLYKTADEKNGNLLDPMVLAASTELDEIIVHLQRRIIRG